MTAAGRDPAAVAAPRRRTAKTGAAQTVRRLLTLCSLPRPDDTAAKTVRGVSTS
ncbi:hypothetical protein AB0M44_20560 [Streptosporangium subroseum]|uniref:hypothetical protein n=1 Tax=Streptosporangium subroseum TaxID=106412 RepID=UPI00344103A1